MADSHYHSNSPLTYYSKEALPILSVVTVPLRGRNATGFIISELSAAPDFKTREIKSLQSPVPLPRHCLQLAEWIQAYYASTLAEALRQFTPSKPVIRKRVEEKSAPVPQGLKPVRLPTLTKDQQQALAKIQKNHSSTVLLHGETGTGKTRVYLELAKQTLAEGKSVILLTPEISLTSQLLLSAKQALNAPIYVFHSELSDAARKKIWFEILEAKQPIVIIGPRSALFSPVQSIGLIVVDEAHEPAYKQDQAPYYHASRAASQLAILCGARVILGSATPSILDYYLAEQKKAIVRMSSPATGQKTLVKPLLVDIKNRSLFGQNFHMSNVLIDEIKSTLNAKKQIIIYLNRRGTARDILCNVCGWHFFCPNCDIPLVYHGDQHLARCHICGYKSLPPTECPKCSNPEIIYRSIGTKTLTDEIQRLFPNAKVRRFDSDNLPGEHLHEAYSGLVAGDVDILVGTQLLAKGLDLPRLSLVGIINAETSLGLPDFTSEERAFQLLYQIIGRVGRGHSDGTVVVQSYDPSNVVIRAALKRDWLNFYKHAVAERQQFKFPPFCYLLQAVCRRATEAGAEKAAINLKKLLQQAGGRVEIIGPSPSFYARRGKYYYFQIILKSKDRKVLLELAKHIPSDWRVNLDPTDLL